MQTKPDQLTSQTSDRTFALLAAALVVVTTAMVALAIFGLQAMTSVRAYVGGEALWSRGQKDAVHDLVLYAGSSDERHYQKFWNDLAVPIGDRTARIELQKPAPDLHVVFAGFIAGGNAPEDVAGMATFFRRFHDLDYLARSIEIWQRADEELSRLEDVAERLHAEIISGQPRAANVRASLDELEVLNARATRMENDFSGTLGAGARWLKRLLSWLTVATALVLVTTSAVLCRALLGRIARTEQRALVSERRFRALIEHSSDGISVIDASGTITYRSASVNRLLGPRSHAAGGSMFARVHPDDLALVEQKWAEVLQKPGQPVSVICRVRHADSSWRVIETILVNLLSDPSVGGVVSNFRDVTDRKRSEAQLIAADRMVSVGTLASGVAHEINNPLAYVISNLTFAAETLGPAADAEVKAAIDEAREGADRVRRIVGDLKTFSRADAEQHGPVDMLPVLDASVNLAWNEIRHRARLVKAYQPGLRHVLGNGPRLGQVFLNLLVNAAQAIPAGDSDQHEIRIEATSKDGRVSVVVQDTGSGIAEKDRPHIFDPFFTTKPIGEGTGLGLFICHNIVASLGGSISVESKPGLGTRFLVDLPAADCSPLPA